VLNGPGAVWGAFCRIPSRGTRLASAPARSRSAPRRTPRT